MIYKKFILFIFALIFWSNNLDAATPLNIKLSNGLEVILIENHQSPVISCVVTVKTGASNEDFSNSGVSHMLEHLLFNGTEKRTQEELYKETDFYGIYNNAHTDMDYTNYIILVEKSRAEKAIDIQSDMLFNSTFPEDKFEKEKGIILNEIARDMSEPSSFEDELFNLRFFDGTPYNLPVIGLPETIKNISREQVKEYYERYYVPNNMTALIMGDFNSSEMLRLAEKYFGKYPPKNLLIEKSYFLKTQNQRFETNFKITHSSLSIGIPLSKADRDDFYGMFIIASLLDSELKERVNKNLKEKNKEEIFDIDASIDFNKHFSLLKISASFTPKLEPQDVENAVVEELIKFSNEQIDEERRKGIVLSVKVQEVFLSEKPHYYGMAKGKFIAVGGWDFAKNFTRRLEDIPKTRLAEIGKKYLSNPVFMINLITPGDSSIEDIRKHIKGDYYQKPIKEEEIFTEDSVKLVNEWEKKIQKTEVRRQKSEEKQKTKKRGEIKKVVLKNGLTIIVNSNRDSDVFAIHLLAKNRSLMEPEGKTGVVDFIHRIMERGTREKDYKTFKKELSSIGAILKTRDSEFIPYDDFYTTNEYSYIRLETIDEYFDKGIEILSDIISKPRFESEDIESVRLEMLNLIKKEDSRPDTLSKKLLFAEVFKGLPQSKPIIGNAETISSITKEDLENFHKFYFSPNNLIITVSTGVEADKIIKAFNKTLGNKIKRRINIPSIDYSKSLSNPSKSINIELNKSQSYIRLAKLIKIEPKDKIALNLISYILSERMAFELRERQGLAYSLGAGFSSYNSHALFGASIGTTIGTVEKAKAGIFKEIDGFKKTEIKGEDLERAVNKYTSSELMRGLSRINQCYYTGLAEFHKKGIDYQKRLLADLKKVKLDEINRAKERYLNIENMIEVVVK
ncbi:MAG: insulinase family protein [Nitrospinae bacterium]|nr:insulinase family protein [Nitrospinota bacterium]